jgi:hypothetical protein
MLILAKVLENFLGILKGKKEFLLFLGKEILH